MLQPFHSLLETGRGRSVLVSQGPSIFLTRLLIVIPAEVARDYAQMLALFVCFSSLVVEAGFLLDNTYVVLGKQERSYALLIEVMLAQHPISPN